MKRGRRIVSHAEETGNGNHHNGVLTEDDGVSSSHQNCNQSKQLKNPTVVLRSHRAGKSGSGPALCTVVHWMVIAIVLAWTAIVHTFWSLHKTSSATTTGNKNFYQIIERHTTTTTTLALLYPPGLLGGYRNQVIRLTSLCVHAHERNLTQLLLRSLLWNTQIATRMTTTTTTTTTTSKENVTSSPPLVKTKWYPIPMDRVFDIEHWNAVADEHSIASLPRLVELDQVPSVRSCWKHDALSVAAPADSAGALHHWQQVALAQGHLPALANLTISHIATPVNPRLLPDTLAIAEQHGCHRILPSYGGGRGRAGRLWQDAMRHRQKHHALAQAMEEWVLRALQPNTQWRQVAEQCVARHGGGQYVTVHARVEAEMMHHACGHSMEFNLTNILRQVHDLVAHNYTSMSAVMVAVGRSGMQDAANNSSRHAVLLEYNWNTLNRYSPFARDHSNDQQSGTTNAARLGTHGLQVFECGERVMEDYYRTHPDVPDHGTLLQSALNFYLAVQADVFVGVAGSSYSTDVLTTRYFLGKGATNYRYTKHGAVEAVVGKPAAHTTCARKK